MMLYAEIHHTPADDAEQTNIDGGIDMDSETFLEELPKLLRTKLADAGEDDEFIVTIAVRELEE